MFFLTPPLDLKLFLLVNQEWRNALFDSIMPIFSSMTALLIAMALVLLIALFKGGKRQLIFFCVLLIGMGLSDVSTGFVKKQIHRVRPLNAIASTHHQANGYWEQRTADYKQTKENGTSYPSAHAANTMCLAILIMLLWPRFKRWPLLLPLAVGYSRLYVGKHYPTDVMAGWLMGAIVAIAVWLIWEYYVRKRIP